MWEESRKVFARTTWLTPSLTCELTANFLRKFFHANLENCIGKNKTREKHQTIYILSKLKRKRKLQE